MINKRLDIRLIDLIDYLWRLSVIDLHTKNDLRVELEKIHTKKDYWNYLTKLYDEKKINWYCWMILMELNFL